MAAQAVGAVGITIGIATASLLARDLSGSEKLAGLAQTFQVLGTAVSAFLLARLMSRRGRRVGLVDGLPPRDGRRRPRGGGRRPRLDGAAAGGRGAARRDDGGEQRRAVRRHRPRARPPPRPVAVARGLGDHDRGRGRSQPDRRRPPGWPTGSASPRSPGRSPSAASGCSRRRWSSRSSCVPTRCWSPGRRRERRSTAPAGTSWGRAVQAVRERPVLGYAVTGLAAAHAAMVAVMVMTPLHMEHGGAELRGDRHRDQRPRARHVRVLAAGRAARRPARAGSRAGAGRGGAAGVAGPLRGRAGGQLVADLRGAVPARPGLVVRDRGLVHDDRRPRPAGRTDRRAGGGRPGDGADRGAAPAALAGRGRRGVGLRRPGGRRGRPRRGRPARRPSAPRRSAGAPRDRAGRGWQGVRHER